MLDRVLTWENSPLSRVTLQRFGDIKRALRHVEE